MAAYAGESAYEPVGSVEENEGRTDWQRFLDLVEVRTGNADAAQVYRTWVVDADQTALLDERATARRAYTDVDAADGDWLPPLGLRSAMTDWDFAAAGDIAAGIETAPADAAAVQEAADAAGLPEPDAVREAYEEAADADAYAALGSMLPRAVAVVGDVGDASRSAAVDRGPSPTSASCCSASTRRRPTPARRSTPGTSTRQPRAPTARPAARSGPRRPESASSC